VCSFARQNATTTSTTVQTERELAAKAAELERTRARLAEPPVAAAMNAIIDELLHGALRSGKSGERSAEAVQRRRRLAAQKAKAKVAAAAATAAAVQPTPVPEAQSGGGGGSTEREAALVRQLQQQAAVLKNTRKQLKRASNTSAQRGQQLKQRGSKEQKRLSQKAKAKRQRDVAGAARREHERVRKRKQPSGPALHSSDRKHRRLLAAGGGCAPARGPPHPPTPTPPATTTPSCSIPHGALPPPIIPSTIHFSHRGRHPPGPWRPLPARTGPAAWPADGAGVTANLFGDGGGR
jgi:hypothetical protein